MPDTWVAHMAEVKVDKNTGKVEVFVLHVLRIWDYVLILKVQLFRWRVV